MLTHRKLCKSYATAYQTKLSNKGKVPADQQIILDHAEKTLDLFNLVVIRQKIEMEVCIGFSDDCIKLSTHFFVKNLSVKFILEQINRAGALTG